MSVLSASSFGSSLNSGVNQLQLPGKTREAAGNLEDEEDEDAMDEQQPGILTGIFGVIYTVSRERTITWQFVTFKLFLDCWQLLMLIINPQYGWKIDGSQEWWKVVSIVQLTDFMANRGLTFFLACLYIFVILLLGTVCICAWVAWSFKNKRFDHVWPITLLRWFGVIFFQLLDVASMSFFLITLDCQYFDVDPALMYHNQEFPAQYCWQLPFLINVVVATLSLLVFVTLATLFQMGEMELNLTTKNPLGMAHSLVEVQSFLLKFMMACASTFLNNLKWMSTFYTVCGLLLVYLAVQRNPYYSNSMNYVRAAINGSVLYCSSMMMLLVFMPGVDDQDAAAVDAWRSTMTIVMVAGLVPAACVTALASHLRVRYFLKTVVGRFRSAAPNTKSHFIHEFSSPLEVEIAARCCRKWVDKDTLEEEAVMTAGTILKAGMQQLPGNAYMCILYSSYLIEVQGSYQSGLAELKAAKKADPSFLEKFAIFSREQQHTQRASGAKGKGAKGADLVSYVEQQRDYRLAIKVHKEALRVTGVFWRSLVHPLVKLEALAQAVADFDVACRQADSTYRSVILRNPENWKLIRMYSKFVEFIKNDPWTAAKWSAEADRLFQEEDDEKHNAVLSDALVGDDVEGQNSQAIKAAMDDGNRGVIIINAQGLMTTVNKTTCNVLGYVKKQLLGKNVSMLIPQPFSKAHDSYIANYVRTGSSNVLNRASYVLALHSDRNVVPIGIHITKISGVGMDSVFMGIFEHLPPPHDVACAWVLPTGSIMSVDATFSDWFGYQNRDMPGGTYHLSNLIADPKAILEVMRAALSKAKDEPSDQPLDRTLTALSARIISDARDNVVLDNVHIKHKYAGPISCSLSMMTQGMGGLRQFVQIAIRQPQQLAGMIVSDRRGKLCHVSSDVAKLLGYPVPLLLGEMAQTAWDTLLPEPFCHLHRAYMTQDLPSGIPPFSCRSGLSMVLMTSSANGPEPQPFSMQVKARKLESGDTCNIVNLSKTSMVQALDERRLSIKIDENGIIVAVGDSPEKLFGYDPKRMLGMPISSFIDVFAPDDMDGGSHDSHLQEILVELAIRSLSVPGSAFRVGVSAAADMHVGQLTGMGGKTRRNSLLGNAIAAHILTRGQHPAVMQVKLHLGETTDGSQSPPLCRSNSGKTRQHALSRGKSQQLVESILRRVPGSVQSAELKEPQQAAAAAAAGPPESIVNDSVLSFPAARNPPAPPAFYPASAAASSGLMLEVELWRADLMTGVLQLDSSGCVVSTSDIPLFQPGPLLGVDSNALVGAHISDILTPMHHHGLEDLFLPELGAGPQELHQAKKGGLKAQKKSGADRDRKPGPAQIMCTSHLVDGMAMEISVQAVPSAGHKKAMHIILRPTNPGSGMMGFREWLRANPQAGKHVSAAQKAQDVPLLRKPGSLHSANEDLAQVDIAHLSILQQQLPPHLRSSARSMMSAVPIRAAMLPGGKRRSASVTILLPGERAAMAAALEGEGGAARDSAAEDNELAVLPRLHQGSPPPLAEAADDPVYAQLDKALEELQAAAARAQSRRNSTGQMGDQHSSSNISREIELGPLPVQEKSGSCDLIPQAAPSPDRTHAWVHGGGSVHSTSLDPLPAGCGMGAGAYLKPPASLSGSNANSHDAGSVDSIVKGGAQAPGQHGDKGDLDVMMKDAIGALGGHRSSPSDNGSGLDEPLVGAKQDANNVETGSDYKRGQRFKRIARLLTGDAAKRDLRLFKMQAWAAAIFVLAVTMACFVSMLILLNKQQGDVLILNTVGLVGVEVGEVFTGLINCDLLISNQFVSTLPGLQSNADLSVECLDRCHDHGIKLQGLLSSAFYSIMSMSGGVDLHAMWSTPYFNITVYTDGVLPGDINITYKMMSMFDAGNLYAQSSLAMAQNIVEYNKTVPYWRQWSHPMNIHNSSGALFIGIGDTLDELIEIVIAGAQNLNSLQYTLMALEGIVCSLLAVAFMFFVVTRVSIQRWNLYSVFMVVPTTLLKTLVKKTAMIEDLGHADREGGNQEAATGQEAEEGTAVKLNVGSAASLKNASILGMFGEALKSLLFWRRRSGVSPVYTKRTLVRSHLTAVWLSSPFLMWGIMMIAINMSGHSKLAQVSGPIAIFNLVNVVTMDYYRVVSLVKDMMQVGLTSYIVTDKGRFNTRYPLTPDYSAMLLGSQGVPGLNLSRYTLAPTGVAFSGHGGPELLYSTHECLRTNQSSCLAYNHTLYQVMHGGLDGMMRLFMKTVDFVRGLDNAVLIANMQRLPQFATVWDLSPDIEGGLTLLTAQFYQYVISVYSGVLTIHIIGLVMSILIIAVFLLFMLRPYAHQLGNETKRIAELLSQLPSDVDVEGLIRRAQMRTGSKGSDDLAIHGSMKENYSFPPAKEV